MGKFLVNTLLDPYIGLYDEQIYGKGRENIL